MKTANVCVHFKLFAGKQICHCDNTTRRVSALNIYTWFITLKSIKSKKDLPVEWLNTTATVYKRLNNNNNNTRHANFSK